MLLTLKETIAHHKLVTHKSLGQHFLTDTNLLAKIVRLSGVGLGDHVIEIGAGPGGLTRALLASDVASVTAVEVDTRCLPILEELRSHDGRLRVVHGDALKMTLEELALSPRAVVANLPYNVGTQILVRYLRAIAQAESGAGAVTSMTVMLQKEVADRITATPDTSDYGRLSVLSQWLCEAVPCMDVPPAAFSPPPKVMSAVIRLTPRTAPLFPAPFEQVETFLHAAFGQRRKMLRGALKGYCPNPTALLEQAGIDPTRRAETLTLQEVGCIITLHMHNCAIVGGTFRDNNPRKSNEAR
jgi:16S rRNA (adenine1518-N6/adenine1519-N6)-dimethyltransferase